MSQPDPLDSLIPAKRLTFRQAATRLGVHVATVGRWARQGVGGVRLRTTKLGGRVLISIPDLVLFLQSINSTSGSSQSSSPGTASSSPSESGNVGGGGDG